MHAIGLQEDIPEGRMELNMGLAIVDRLDQKPIRTVLLIESDAEEARLFAEMFNRKGQYPLALTRVECVADAETYLAGHATELVLLDLDCSDARGMEAVERIGAAARGASLVLLSSQEDEAMAMLAMEGGVQDYLIKGLIEPRELMQVMSKSIARRVTNEALLNEHNRAQIMLDAIGDAVICTDETGNITFLNPAAEQMTGWSMKEAIGRPLAESFQIMDASTGQAASDPTTSTAEPGRSSHLPVNCILTRRDGHQIFIENSVAPIDDVHGLVAGSVLVFRDVSAARALSEKITHLAEHDALTGLPNRLLLTDRLAQAIAAAGRKSSLIAVLFLDLDGFKSVNDSLGHSAGDDLLKSVAKRLQGCVRAQDTVSRQGGDEFVVLLQDMQQVEFAAMMAGRILKELAAPFSIRGHELCITASIGVCVYPTDGMDAETLIMNADAAMYKAKESGRQNFRFHTRHGRSGSRVAIHGGGVASWPGSA
jgi:diguanylate cyclase (GGDEF)-like protein/PAS domain S-box-containing protein